LSCSRGSRSSLSMKQEYRFVIPTPYLFSMIRSDKSPALTWRERERHDLAARTLLIADLVERERD
jgi:hypothetical protein